MNNLDLTRKKILIFGDYIIDEYIIGESNSISYEAPIPIIKRTNAQYFSGGSGNLANNVVSLGGECDLVSIIGIDQLEKVAFSNLEQSGVGTDKLITIKDRANSLKTRVLCNSKHVARIDSDPIEPLDYSLIYPEIDKILEEIKRYDLVVIQDLGKKFIDSNIIRKILRKSIEVKVKVILDLPDNKVSDYSPEDIRGISILKTNLSGFRRMNGIIEDGNIDAENLKKLSKVYIGKYGIESILVTLGSSGVFYTDSNIDHYVSGYESNVYDVTGAGDSAAAALSLCTAANIDIAEGIKIVNLTGFIACNYTGSVAVTAEELIEGYSIMNQESPSE